MNVASVRRTAVAALVAVLGLGGLVAAGSAQASTGLLTYSCGLPAPIGATAFQISADTNAPATVYLGTSVTPTLTTVAYVPADLASLIGGAPLSARSVDGTIVSTVKINGTPTPITQTFKNQPIPAKTTASVPVVAKGAAPKLKPTKAGSITYVPGDLVVSLHFHKAGGGSAGDFSDIPCTAPQTSKVIDKVALAKSPTKVTPSATYAKASKKLTATAKVTATSRLVPTGTVTAVLYKGAAKVKSVTAALKAGKATAVFSGVSAKGAYKVVLSYAGSATNNTSSASKALTAR